MLCLSSLLSFDCFNLVLLGLWAIRVSVYQLHRHCCVRQWLPDFPIHIMYCVASNFVRVYTERAVTILQLLFHTARDISVIRGYTFLLSVWHIF